MMFFGKGLPVQIIRTRQSRLAGAFAASMLMDDDASQRFRSRGNPQGKVYAVGQLPLFGRWFVPHAIVRRLGGRVHIVGWRLGCGRQAPDDEYPDAKTRRY